MPPVQRHSFHLIPLMALAACTAGTPPPDPPRATPTLALARQPGLITALSLPESSRSLPIPGSVEIRGPWQSDWRTDTVVQWSIPLPVRGIDFGFGRSRAPSGVRLTDATGRKKRWEYAREQGKGRPGSWDVSRGRLRIRLPATGKPPQDWTLEVPRLKELEEQLQHAIVGGTASEFAFRTALVDEQSRHGLFLPAPAQLAVELPAEAVGNGTRLRTTVRLLAPFVDGPALGDGATVRIHCTRNGAVHELWSEHVSHGQPVELDLALPDGESPTTLTLHSSGGPSDDNNVDYVFFDEPTVYTPTATPRKVLVVLIDTLRADRLGSYGYGRPTSPTIDRLARTGTRFDNAHAPAPWTLPSTRALLSGQSPEAWTPLDHIGTRLGAEGFATALISGNTYISRYVDMHLGWTWHEYRLFSGADRQLDKMGEFLERHQGQDTLVVLQLMEPHLPYREPADLRNLWAGPTPDGLRDSFSVTDVRKWDKKGLLDEAARTWVSDRYDQNVRAADAAVDKALALMGEDTLVVIASDHGEELWDHGGFEHGHALWEELVRVPLVISGPGVPHGRVSAPVGLRDVSPTLLGLLDLAPDPDATGLDLRAVMNQDTDAHDVLNARPLAFRDLLYRSDAVGVLVDGHRKWTFREGEEQVFDLAIDPAETAPLTVDTAPFHSALSTALQREVVTGWRVALPGAGEAGGSRRARLRAAVELTHKDGLTTAFSAPDSRKRSQSRALPIEGGLRLERVPGESMSAEIYVVPGEPRTDPTAPEVTVRQGDRVWTDPPSPESRAAPALRQAGPPSSPVRLTPAVFPLPASENTGQVDIDDEARAGLEALGYLE